MRTIRVVLYLITVWFLANGIFGLVLGPAWIGIMWMTVAVLLLYVAARLGRRIRAFERAQRQEDEWTLDE